MLDKLNDLLPAILAGAASGIATYTAIRIEMAVLKVRMDHAERDLTKAHALAGDAHDRINRMRRREDHTTL